MWCSSSRPSQTCCHSCSSGSHMKHAMHRRKVRDHHERGAPCRCDMVDKPRGTSPAPDASAASPNKVSKVCPWFVHYPLGVHCPARNGKWRVHLSMDKGRPAISAKSARHFLFWNRVTRFGGDRGVAPVHREVDSPFPITCRTMDSQGIVDAPWTAWGSYNRRVGSPW